MTNRLGSRGGTVHSLDEAQVLHELTKPEVTELVRSSILDVLARTGAYTADDLIPYDLPVAAENVIGGVTAGIARKGLMVKVGWVRSENPARHGAENRTYVITDQGRAELARAGVGGVNKLEKTMSSKGATHPGTGDGKPDLAPLPRPGGGSDTHSQPGTVAAVPDDLQLPLVDVPQGASGRAIYEDYDEAA